MSMLVLHKKSSLSCLLPSSLAQLIPLIVRRYESSARRTTKRLRTKPDASFTASIRDSRSQEYIVFNPPSSIPSPYHTPQAFLPVNDPRRILLAQSHLHDNPYDQPDQRLPPPVRKEQREKNYHLNEKDIENIRHLRLQNPFKWTRRALAEKFECSQFFVGMICEAPAERKKMEAEKLEAIKARWGQRRINAREDRAKRRDLWGRDS